MATPTRILRLLSLLQTRRDWTGAELAARLEVAPRTIRKDVERLRDLGYPIEGTRGGAGGYRLGKGAAMPPLLLEDDEAVAVAVALRTTGGSVAGVEDASLRALAKLEQILPVKLRGRVSALRSETEQFRAGTSAARVDPDVLATLASASRDRDRVRFEYEAAGGERSRRSVEPQRLVAFNRRWYLVAWDIDRADWRTFRLDRIAGVWRAGGRFERRDPPEKDLAAYVARRVSEAGWRYHVRAVVHAPYEQIAPRINAAVGKVERVDDRTCVVESGSDSIEMIGVYLGLLGAPFTITEPPELVELVAALGDRYLAAVSVSRGS